MTDRPRHAETVFVGGGVISLATAFELASEGHPVLVLERDRPGAGASDVAAGMLAPAAEALDERHELLRFGLESLRRYPEFVQRVEQASGLPCGYRTEPALWVALDRDHREHLELLHGVHRELGLESRRLVSAEVRRLEPRLTGRVVAGLELSHDHRVDSPSLVAALAAAVRSLGGTICSGCCVESIRTCRSGLEIAGQARAAEGGTARPFEMRADRVVLAAGAWCSHGIEHPARDLLRVRPVKGQSIVLRGERLLSRIVQTPDVYVVPRGEGELVVGASVEEQGFDDSPRAGVVRELQKRAWEVLPGIDELTLSSLPVSFRPATPDHMPVIGGGGADGFFVATGHYRNGMLLAPATAHHLAQMLLKGSVPDALAPFRMERFDVGSAVAASAAARRREAAE